MSDKPAFKPQECMIVSSDSIRQAMRPHLRQVMTMRVINDNRNIDTAAIKELGFMALGIVVMLTVALSS